MTEIQEPTNKLLDQYIAEFNNNENYFSSDKAILNLIKLFPENKKLEDILLKVSLINVLYSTNIYGVFKMAKHILKLDIDNEIKNGNPNIINKIATGHGIQSKKNNKEINFYSFASKYCSWHNQNCFAIYDSFVSKVLFEYNRKHNFSIFKQKDLKDYNIFMRIIQDFINHFHLNSRNLKEIDKFLWIYGKEKFQNIRQ